MASTVPTGSATRSSYQTSWNRAGSRVARSAVNRSSPDAHSSSWSRPSTFPVKTEDQPADACAARLQTEAIEVRGARWVWITSASG